MQMRFFQIVTVICLSASISRAAEIISRSLAVSQTAAGSSYAPVISANGRYIMFTSAAANLTTNQPGQRLALFLHDLTTRQTTMIGSDAAYPSFSLEGDLFAFVKDIDGISQISLHDQQSGSTTFVTAGSLASPAGKLPNGSSRPMLTPAGHWLLFESSATNLVNEPDTNGMHDLFLRDLPGHSNILISVGQSPRPGILPRDSLSPSMTPDGQRVAFVSRNIPVPTTNSAVRTEALVRDVAQRSYYWASTNVEAILGSAASEYVCFHPLLSSNGAIVVFKVAPVRGSTNGLVLHHELATAKTTIIASNSVPQIPAALSSDGRYLAYDSLGQIWRYDAETGSNELATLNAAGTGPANGTSLRPVLTPDARVLVFVSDASDLTPTGNSARKSQIYLRAFDSRTTRLVSRNTNGQPAVDLVQGLPEINQAGTRVVFDYAGNDLAADDLNDSSDVFVYDAADESVTLVSRALPESPLLTNPGGVGAELNSLSADGGKVTFTACDIPSFAGDTNRSRDVFVADLNTGNIQRLSVGDPMKEFSAGQSVISGNGRFALYSRQASGSDDAPYLSNMQWLFRRDLASGVSEQVAPDASFRTDIYEPKVFFPALSDDGNLVVYSKAGNLYLKDMIAGTNRSVAVSRNELVFRRRQMINPRFTPDHRWVLFQHSFPRDLTTNDFPDNITSPRYNLFAHDLLMSSTMMISAHPSGTGMGTATAKSFSASGRYVAYDVWLQDDSPVQRTNIYVFDFVTRSNSLICSYCLAPSLSADARLIAYAARRTGSSIDDIYVRDRAAGTVARIGENIANDTSGRPLLSADGRYVVFTSKASNYVANDDNGAQDVFLHDRYRGVTYRLSAGSAPSARHIISKDGRTVVFQSLAGDLSPGDYNEALDIFAVRLGAGDADNDGMDDAWETTYFNNTDRDGSGDFDGDRQSDFQEFLAGTDPTNAGSVFEVIAIRSLNPNQVRILWAATPGKSYVIQSKSSLQSPAWTNMTEPISATASDMSIDLASASSLAFYRVVLVH